MWKAIETAPVDEEILAAIVVCHKNGDRFWERHVVVIDSDTGDIESDWYHGWSASDYTHWMPLPDPPALAPEGQHQNDPAG